MNAYCASCRVGQSSCTWHKLRGMWRRLRAMPPSSSQSASWMRTANPTGDLKTRMNGAFHVFLGASFSALMDCSVCRLTTGRRWIQFWAGNAQPFQCSSPKLVYCALCVMPCQLETSLQHRILLHWVTPGFTKAILALQPGDPFRVEMTFVMEKS